MNTDDTARNEALLQRLHDALKPLGSVAVAFSGGVDSTLLLKAAHDVLGDNAIAITASSACVPTREIQEARLFCAQEGISLSIVETHELEIEGFQNNPPNRCYLCKREIMSRIIAKAGKHGIETVAEGSNADDGADHRPGSKAVAELGLVSPLRDAGLSKADVRKLARHLGLSVWNKPAYACLYTRFPHGDLLTYERLSMVERAEYALHDRGFAQARVRMHGDIARIEVPECDIERLASADTRKAIADELRAIGFAFVSVDLQGYRMGSMNETL